MRKSIFVFMLLATLPAVAVQATPLEIVFCGTLQPGFVAISPRRPLNWDNRAFSGIFVFDPATAAYDVTNPEGTYHFSNDNYAVPQHLPWMLTTLDLPNGVVQSGDDSAQFQSLIQLYRNYGNPAGSNLLTLNVYDQYGVDPFAFHLAWEVVDYLGTASTLFSDSNAGVSYTQPFNLAGETQFGEINIQGSDYQYHGDFVLSSLSIMPVPLNRDGTLDLHKPPSRGQCMGGSGSNGHNDPR